MELKIATHEFRLFFSASMLSIHFAVLAVSAVYPRLFLSALSIKIDHSILSVLGGGRVAKYPLIRTVKIIT